MTREQLHRQVWSQPMRTLAKSMGISDVALAKRCKSVNVPVPPRGWWARKEAGKPVAVTPLPPPPFVLANYFPARIHRVQTGESLSIASEVDDAVPDPPTFRDMMVVADEIRAIVNIIKVPATLAAPHPIVARLLKQDAERKPKPSASPYFSDRYGPKFATPIQQRRLRILSCILSELDRLGCKAQGSTHAGERFSISVGGYWIYIQFGVEGGGPYTTYFNNDRRGYKPPNREQLRFDMVEHGDRDPPKLTWRDGEQPLERQVTDIVRGLLLRAEEDTRKWAIMSHKWDCEDRARRLREAKLAAEKAEADRIARDTAAAAARVEALLGGAEALERAARIRRYVAAVRVACAETPNDESIEHLERWTKWALDEANAIDPVASGRFVSDLLLQNPVDWS